MQTKLFLDLEETVIVSLENITLINVDYIKSFIEDQDIEEVYIFSFAIDNEVRHRLFDEKIKNLIETTFNVKVVKCFTLDEIIPVVFKANSVAMPVYEFLSIMGKLKVFQDFCRETYTDFICTLIDDVTPSTTLIFNEIDLIVNTIRVSSLISLTTSQRLILNRMQ